MSSPERNNETRDKNNHHHHDNNMNNDQTHPDGKETNEKEKGKETRQQMDKERGIELLGGSLVDCLGFQTPSPKCLGFDPQPSFGQSKSE